MNAEIDKLEKRLDSFDARERHEALAELWRLAQEGKVALAEVGEELNIHVHSFHSYNSLGYSPSAIAWHSRKCGLRVTGIMDFDAMDGVAEFYAACRLVGVKATAGIESRVYLPEMSETVINSPGEPGVVYDQGIGIPSAAVPAAWREFLASLKRTAQQRNLELLKRVNDYLEPVRLDYERDVLPLTPGGNATERHICIAYAQKAQQAFKGEQELGAFWAGKLGINAAELGLPAGVGLQGAIRAKIMKQGGVGYVQPGKGSFPKMSEMNGFIRELGGIPVLGWLDGSSEGESEMERLLEVVGRNGVASVFFIFDLAYTASGKMDEGKMERMRYTVKAAEKAGMLLIGGTEINKPGQKLVPGMSEGEWADLTPAFVRSADIVYAHTVLQRQGGMGYLSGWAEKCLPELRARGDYFAQLGEQLTPESEGKLEGLKETATPEEILGLLG